MAYKQHLLDAYPKVYQAKQMLDNLDQTHIDHQVINPHDLDSDTVSIVMTTYNRSSQTYFTIETISKSRYKNVQVIIVDDSTTDPVRPEILERYNTHIELIRSKSKFWHNPCVNYNIGFKHVKGSKTIIQNGEVCHIGDVIDYVAHNGNVQDDQYHVFDTAVTLDLNTNLKLHALGDTSFSNYSKVAPLIGGWYQHFLSYNVGYHFLAAMTTNTLHKLGGFDIDYCTGSSYDDNELVFRIKSANIKIVNLTTNERTIGVHQWHPISWKGWDRGVIDNGPLFHAKVKYFKDKGQHFRLTDYPIEEASQAIQELFS